MMGQAEDNDWLWGSVQGRETALMLLGMAVLQQVLLKYALAPEDPHLVGTLPFLRQRTLR